MFGHADIIENILQLYVVIAVSHLMTQFVFAQLHHWRCKKALPQQEQLERKLCGRGEFPSVTIIYPIYNESAEVLEQVLQRAQDCLAVPRLEVIFVDDGSPNLPALKPVYEKYQGERIKVIYKSNGGKREAQYTGFCEASGEYVITVDSDTLIAKEGVYRLISPFLMDRNIGAVCGEVKVENQGDNLLTCLIDLRYWIAFNLERAAQSLFGCILCCSGPFSAYRSDIIQKVKDAYIAQTFLGRKCTYGDDRHLTNLVIAQGCKTIYQPGAIAYTYVPVTLGEYIVQQNRWNKSFFREMLWTIKDYKQVSPFSLYDMLLQPVLFSLFFIVLSQNLYVFCLHKDFKNVIYYIGLLIVMASVRALYGVLVTGNPRFLYFIYYGFLHISVLMPIRFKSLCTLNENSWGTRTKRTKSSVYKDFAIWCLFYYACVVVITGGLFIAFPPKELKDGLAGHFHYAGSIDGFFGSILNSWIYAFMVVPVLVVVLICLTWLRERCKRQNAIPIAAGQTPKSVSPVSEM